MRRRKCGQKVYNQIACACVYRVQRYELAIIVRKRCCEIITVILMEKQRNNVTKIQLNVHLKSKSTRQSNKMNISSVTYKKR